MERSFDVLIIGAGLSGLSVAHFLKKAEPELDLLLLEGTSRVGGAIRSFQEQGFVAEWGPHGFLDNTDESQEILRDMGLDRVAQKASLREFLRFVCHRGRLVALPQHPLKLLKTPLLSVGGKLRILADLWKKPLAEEQSLAQWASYRFGPQVLPLIDAAATGTFAGDFARLSIDAVMPGVRKLEKEHGSVLRGLIRNGKKKKERRGLPAMTNFPGGMEQLIGKLAAGKPIHFNAIAEGISRGEEGWEVATAGGSFSAKTLVLALPINGTLNLLTAFQPPVTSVPESRIATVVMGFSGGAQVPHAFGYLSPESEGRFTLGAMFSSQMFPDRAPSGCILLEALVGGRRHPERLELDDATMVRRVYEDIRQLLSLPEYPKFSRVLRSTSGIPQLEIGYERLLSWKDGLEKEQPGLHVCGFGWEGIGMNEMVKLAKKVSLRVISGRESAREGAEVKPVYF